MCDFKGNDTLFWYFGWQTKAERKIPTWDSLVEDA